jgi:hypothetical protein
MNKTTPVLSGQNRPDYALLLSRVEKVVLRGEITEKHRQLLKKRSLWTRLKKEQALLWARLAQIAGETKVALEVLQWLNETRPEFRAAWKEHWETLNILGRFEEALRLRTKAITRHKDLANLFTHFENNFTNNIQEDEKKLEEPFLERKIRQELLELYLELFQGREDCFARQWADKTSKKQGYVPVRRALNTRDIQEHITGRKTYGIYLLHNNSNVSLAVLDVDLGTKFRQTRLSARDKSLARRERDYILQRIPEVSQKMGFVPLPEFSGGKGYHFWYFFENPVPAAIARKVIGQIAKQIAPDLTCFNIEVFPKQDQLKGNGLGNLVKLPLGIHRVTGKPSFFLGYKQCTVWEQLHVLKKIQRIRADTLEKIAQDSKTAKIVVHPRQKEWAEKYPELALLGEKCPALGQIFASCRAAKELSMREEKVLLGTIGFLSRAKSLLHYLFGYLPEYNPHLVDYKLSRLRGTPLGCKRIHSLLGLALDFCNFDRTEPYAHPLLHCPEYSIKVGPKQEKVENLAQALEQLKICLEQVNRFLPEGS